MLHLHRAPTIQFWLQAEIFRRTPYIADLKPGGRYVAKDMFEVGGIPLLIKTLLDHGFIHGDCMTVTGRTIAENMERVRWNPDQDVVRSAGSPITPTGAWISMKPNISVWNRAPKRSRISR